ncbi:MAG TPA: threonylcarbamoyl-AMP synthase [Firmicutes bacterium]|nr:threonylcarbamoyl-AMP synthase [Bacillota bacterium]
METLHLDACSPQSREQAIDEAARLLKEGQLVIIPTETVYGLAANALDPAAVAGIFAAKGRPQDNPLIVHVDRMEQIPPLVKELPPAAEKLAAAYWPGPLTMILPKSEAVPKVTSGGLDTVAIRMPSQPVARAIIARCGLPLAAPSANLSGSPSPTTALRCAQDMDGRVAAIVDGGPCQVGVESTVVSLVGPVPVVLRPGAITPEMIAGVLGECQVDDSVLHQLKEGQTAASPGMKYKHYAPKASVTILRGSSPAFCREVNRRGGEGVCALCFEEDLPHLQVAAIPYGREGDDLSQARLLFEALRELDEKGARVVYAREPHAAGVGLAVYNRLLRAAGFQVETLPEE